MADCKDNFNNVQEVVEEDNEHWMPIDKTDKYFVSDKGRVMSLSRGDVKILKQRLGTHGYLIVDYTESDGTRRTKTVHRLVASKFLNSPQGIDWQIHHQDFNKFNNSANNLKYVDSMEHSRLHKEKRCQDKEQNIDSCH